MHASALLAEMPPARCEPLAAQGAAHRQDSENLPHPRSHPQWRVLVHAPRLRDAMVIKQVIESKHRTQVCDGPRELLAALKEGAASLVLTQEAITETPVAAELARWLVQQPPWSDFPIAVLVSSRADPDLARAVRDLGNVILLERPLNAETLLSAADAAVRARERQYATRQHLEEISRARAEVQQLNADLERRIEARTLELSTANNRLMKEIAERERVQAALEQGQKMEAIGRLTGGIAHDFNNLLHVVNMNLELISLYATEEKVKPVVERAKSAARRGAKLTGQLLSFARRQSLQPKLTGVNALLSGMKDLLQVSAGSAVELEFDLCSDELHVVVDPSQLEMAVLNLAANSREAMPDGGSLRISTGARHADAEAHLERGDYVVVTVTDSGPGIPPDLLGQVFEPFFTTKPVGSGPGLGLSQVYGFARQSGGVAFIRSELGRGTTVEMWFPAAPAEAQDAAIKQCVPTAPPQAVPPRRILVVEDDADVRRVIVECLALLGYAVTEAPNGTAGIAAITQSPPDLLVVDYAMPDITGAEVIRRARELVGDLPVILATGYADMAAVERLAGRPMILRKPFDMHALGTAVASALQKAAQPA